MKELGYGKGYLYAHDYDGNFVKQQYLPDELKNATIWKPQANAAEERHKERLRALWGDKYK